MAGLKMAAALALIVSLTGLLNTVTADMASSGSLLRCVLRSEDEFQSIFEIMKHGYGCYCNVHPRIFDDPSLEPEPVDAIDKVCREYFHCLKVVQKRYPTKCEGTYSTMSTRLYDDKNPSGTDGCAALTADYCSEGNPVECAKCVCEECDFPKINELRETLKTSVIGPGECPYSSP